MTVQCRNDVRKLPLEQIDEFSRLKVAGSHKQELRRSTVKDMRVVEVSVLRHNNTIVVDCNSADLKIGRAIVVWQLTRVDCVVT